MFRYIVLLGFILLGVSACSSQQSQDFKETRFMLGTIVEFTVYDANETLALKAIQQAAAAMQAVEDEFTTYGQVFNTVKAFNQAQPTEVIQLAPDVEALLLQAINIHEQTLGAFDPTLGELNQLWGFSGGQPPTTPPSKQKISHGLHYSGVENIRHLNKGWTKKIAGLQLDFGAIAKGLAIDKGIEVFKQYGLEHAIINAGGDIRVLGNHGLQPWRIGIRHPRQATALGWIEVGQDLSVVTSGDYERFYMYRGQRYHHILDPKTGEPATQNMSVTVIAETATVADALSTGLFVLGQKQGMDLVEKMAGVEALWVGKDQKIRMSSGMKTIFHISDVAHKK